MPTQLCHGALTASALGRPISRLAKRLVQPVTEFNVIIINQSEVSSSQHAKPEFQKSRWTTQKGHRKHSVAFAVASITILF